MTVIRSIYHFVYSDEMYNQCEVEVKLKSYNKISWGKIFCNEKYKKKVILCSTLAFLQQFCGINTIVFYSSVII
jgi:hypothetical protein